MKESTMYERIEIYQGNNPIDAIIIVPSSSLKPEITEKRETGTIIYTLTYQRLKGTLKNDCVYYVGTNVLGLVRETDKLNLGEHDLGFTLLNPELEPPQILGDVDYKERTIRVRYYPMSQWIPIMVYR